MSAQPAAPRLRFAYWSDPYCIWAYVAQRPLEALLQLHAGLLDVDYHVIPVFGSIPHRFSAGAWAAGGTAGRVAATAKVAAEHGHPEVDGTCWEVVRPSSSWAAGAAIKGVFADEAAGLQPEGAGAAFQKDLREAFFVHRLDTSHRKVQLQRAEGLGLDVAQLERQLDTGLGLAWMAEDEEVRQRSHLQGSPSWVFDGGRAVLYGRVNQDVLRHTVLDLLAGVKPGGSRCG